MERKSSPMPKDDYENDGFEDVVNIKEVVKKKPSKVQEQ